MTRYAIVVVTDDNLYNESCQLIGDLERLCTDAPDLFCFHRGLDRTQLRKLERVPRLTLLPVPTSGVPVGPVKLHIDPALSPLFYARFEAWSDRFDAYDTVVYLDVDTIVLADLAPLSLVDFGVVRELHGGSSFLDQHDPTLVALLREDGVHGDVPEVANAGVFAVGRRWRTEDQRALLDRIADRYAPYLRVADQSVLNVWLHINGLTPTLDRSFNCQIGRGARGRGKLRAIRRARILHFNGLKLSNTRLAIRIARGCFRVPYIGRELFAMMYFAMFRDYRLRPVVARALRLALGTRDRVRAKFRSNSPAPEPR